MTRPQEPAGREMSGVLISTWRKLDLARRCNGSFQYFPEERKWWLVTDRGRKFRPLTTMPGNKQFQLLKDLGIIYHHGGNYRLSESGEKAVRERRCNYNNSTGKTCGRMDGAVVATGTVRCPDHAR